MLAYDDETSGGVNALGIWTHEKTGSGDLESVSQKIMQEYETYLFLTGGQVNLRKPLFTISFLTTPGIFQHSRNKHLLAQH